MKIFWRGSVVLEMFRGGRGVLRNQNGCEGVCDTKKVRNTALKNSGNKMRNLRNIQ
jgi:hypothetical protein